MAQGKPGSTGKPFNVVIGKDDAAAVERAAHDRRMPAAAFIRSAVVERLVADGYLQGGP